jgi:hypothetical protein
LPKKLNAGGFDRWVRNWKKFAFFGVNPLFFLDDIGWSDGELDNFAFKMLSEY